MKVILDKIPASKGFHSGGALAFGKDDKLYITVGDAAAPVWHVQQNSSSPLGKVLRLNSDGTIPKDNPYPGSPVYNIGHRNMYGIAFDDTGFGIVTENGASFFDEINSIQKKGNYGYPSYQPVDKSPELSKSSIKPLRSYWKVIAPTQAIYYQGPISELNGKFLFGSDMGGEIHALRLDNSSKKVIEEEVIQLNHYPYEPVISIAKSPNGEVYYGGYNIYKLNGVDTTNKKRIFTPMEIISAYNTTIENVVSNPSQKKITIAFNPYIIPKNDALSSHPLLILKIPGELIANISSVFASYGNIEKQLEFNISKVGAFFYLTIPNKYADSIRPSVNIANPPYLPSSNSSTTTKTITVNGTASDAISGIQQVEAFAHTFPFDNKFPFRLHTIIPRQLVRMVNPNKHHRPRLSQGFGTSHRQCRKPKLD